MLHTLRAKPGPSRTSLRTNLVLLPMRSRLHVLLRRRARPQADSSAGGSVTSCRSRFASWYVTTSGCGTTSAGQCLAAERASRRQHRPQADPLAGTGMGACSPATSEIPGPSAEEGAFVRTSALLVHRAAARDASRPSTAAPSSAGSQRWSTSTCGPRRGGWTMPRWPVCGRSPNSGRKSAGRSIPYDGVAPEGSVVGQVRWRLLIHPGFCRGSVP